MKKVLVNYGGAIFLYLVIFLGVVAINVSLRQVNTIERQVVLNK